MVLHFDWALNWLLYCKNAYLKIFFGNLLINVSANN